MPEYFSVNLNLGKKGNSIERVSLYACSGDNENTCEATPISGYDNLLWTDQKFSPQYQTSPEVSITGLTTFLTNLILYTHTYIKVSVTSSYYGNCVVTRMIPISGIPTPSPTPTATATPTPTPTPTSIPCVMSGGSAVYTTEPTPTPTPTATPTVTPTPTATPTVTPTPTATSIGYSSFTIYVDTSNNGLGWSTGELACAGTGTSRTMYVDGTGYSSLYDAVVTSGKSLHTGSTINESTLFDGGDLWYKTVENPNEGGNFRISPIGEVPTFNQTGCVLTPSYGISVSPTTADDGGGAFTATVTAANISFPQTLYITILSTVGTVNLFDFQNGFPSSISLTESGQEFSFSLAEDQSTEDTEKFKLQLRSESASGTILATSSEITITDGSLDIYYYTLAPCAGGSNLYSTGYQQGTFSSRQRVQGSSNTYYVIAGSSTTDPGGNKISVTPVDGQFECPEVAPPPNPDRTMYFIQTGTTQQVNEWCSNTASPVTTNGGYNVYITYNLAPLTPPNTYTIYKNPSDGDSELFHNPGPNNQSEYIPFVLFGGSPTKVIWKGSISPSSVIQDWTQCTLNTTPNWVSQYSTCDNCTTYTVYLDTNTNSATSGRYKYNDIVRDSQPSNGACNTSQVQGSQIGTRHYCQVDNEYTGQGDVYTEAIYGNSNSCYSGPDTFLWNGSWVSSNPSNNESDVRGENWLTYDTNCIGNVTKYSQKDWGPCSLTFGDTRTIDGPSCGDYTTYGYYTLSCEGIDGGGTEYTIVYSSDFNNYRLDDGNGSLVTGVYYNIDTRRATYFDNGSLLSTDSSSCD